MYSNSNEIRNIAEFNYGIERISSWYRSKSRNLSIITIPYNSTLIFSDIIMMLIREGKQILYIWNGRGIKQRLINYLTKIHGIIGYDFIEEGKSKESIVFVNYEDIENIGGSFDLVIYDDISYYSSSSQINNIYKRLSEKFKKVILYSIGEAEGEEEFYLGPLLTEKPFVEPRIINTRIDLNKDIPGILYDYLKWFRDEKKKVLLLVPDEENINYLYDYYVNKLKMDRVEILRSYKGRSEDLKKAVLKFENQSIFILTNNMEVVLKDFAVDEAVILFADNMAFSYKKFLYICAYIGKVNKLMPEVLLVSKDISLEMDTAKDISRNFNKIIWEKKLK